jgi:hypothetical protein
MLSIFWSMVETLEYAILSYGIRGLGSSIFLLHLSNIAYIPKLILILSIYYPLIL